MLRIKKSEFVTSVGKNGGYPSEGGAEIAIVGKSNVGKSSIINSLCNMNKLAKTSQKPGKTRLINYFRINGDFYIVDLPGYGFAQASKQEQAQWGELIESYLASGRVKHIFMLVDIRHEPSAQDVQMYDYLRYYGLDGVVVATKADKISKNQQQKSIRQIRQKLNMKKEDVVIPVSALKRTGQEELLDVIESILNKEGSEDEHK